MIPSPPETRASLILRLRDAADVAAWDEFVAIYGPLVYRLALGRGLQPADADDVVQQVFTAVAQSVGRWVEQPERGRFRGWLLGIARNIALKTLTRRPHGGVGLGGQQSPERLETIEAPGGPLSSQFDIEFRREVYRWAACQVREAIEPNTWNAFHLTHVEGVSIAEAAAQLNISVGNVYIARSRVIRRLRVLAKQFEVSE
ncbi:ECF RNA polymerase sigma factor SigE [Rubripirellula tenax]|uniref:ECF RNA polymerase sigma factor SigE n=1 Tax=Rubripirellula tenax TaxID=2528015 RepID=A0A5C6E6T2_9BACT|nr:sigma-70 family RNA polymerase sigma factor [Rubripirellula tenax]TWU43667.1 ECF RNA polymerase sigma factor SigE [Rubripirellula tenax]